MGQRRSLQSGAGIRLDLPRSTPRWLYKAVFRYARVVRREYGLAYSDMLICGTGFVKVTSDGNVRRVPYSEVIAA